MCFFTSSSHTSWQIVFFCLKVLPHPPLFMSPSMPCFYTMSAPDAYRPNKPKPAVLSLYLFHRFLPQSHSGGSSDEHLSKTSFVQKGRSMFPKVLLQWCTAISSCAAEIGKLGSTTFRLSALSASYLCCKVMALSRCNTKPCHLALVAVWPALVQSRCHCQMMFSCWVAQERWDAASCYAATILWCSCILVKGISLLL